MKFGYSHSICDFHNIIQPSKEGGGAGNKSDTNQELYHGYPLLSRFEPDILGRNIVTVYY